MDTKMLISYAQNGDEEALERLIRDNSPLVWSIVKRFMGRGYDKEELYQIGVIGLIKCIKKFNLSLNLMFSTYAVPMIMGEIKRFLRDNGSIKVSRSLKEIASRARYEEERFIKEKGQKPTVNELCEILNIDAQTLIMAQNSLNEIKSIYHTINNDDNNPVYLIDKLTHDDNFNESIIDSIVLKQMIERLDTRDKKIIILRYFKDKTQSEVARIIGISQVQVSRIEKKIIDNFRKTMSG